MSSIAAVTLPEILAMQGVDVRSVDRSALRDIRDVPVQTDLPRQDRILDFIRRIGNPYCFNYKGYVVKISHIKTDTTLQELVLDCIRENCAKEVF